MSGDNDGSIAFTAFGEHVHEEALHPVRSCGPDVHAVASARIKFVGLARCRTLEDGSLAAEGQEILEGQRSFRIKDRRGGASVQSGVRQVVHSLRIQA